MSKNIEWKKSEFDYDELNKLTHHKLVSIENGKNLKESGKLKEISKLGGKASGKIQGKKNVESGHWDRVTKIGRKKGLTTQIENNIGMFNPENRKKNATKGGYTIHQKYTLDELKSKGFCNGSPLIAILQCDLNGNIIMEWDSQKSAAIALNTRHQHIQAVLSGRRNSHKGFIWKYKNE